MPSVHGDTDSTVVHPVLTCRVGKLSGRHKSNFCQLEVTAENPSLRGNKDFSIRLNIGKKRNITIIIPNRLK